MNTVLVELVGIAAGLSVIMLSFLFSGRVGVALVIAGFSLIVGALWSLLDESIDHQKRIKRQGPEREDNE